MPADARPMYRAQALRAQAGPALGEIVLAQPPGSRSWVLLGLLAGLLVLALLVFGQYTRRVAVAGQLMPSQGLLRISAPAPAVLRSVAVHEGQRVRAGQLLATLSFERQAGGRSVDDAVRAQLLERERSLREELARAGDREAEERHALAQRLASLAREQVRLDEARRLQARRLALAEDGSARYEALLGPGHVSRDEWQQRRAEALEQQARAQALDREHETLRRELEARRAEQRLLGAGQQRQREGLARELARAIQDREEADGRRMLQLVAPADAVVAAVLAEPGQSVDAQRTLLRLMPPDDPLQAVLYAPSRAAGPLKVGDPVLLRYQAFPHPAHGLHRGTIRTVATTPVAGAELQALSLGLHPQLQPGGEPHYRITVALPAQSLDGPRGRALLRPGMLLEADLRTERRRLIAWAFEPLRGVAARW